MRRHAKKAKHNNCTEHCKADVTTLLQKRFSRDQYTVVPEEPRLIEIPQREDNHPIPEPAQENPRGTETEENEPQEEIPPNVDVEERTPPQGIQTESPLLCSPNVERKEDCSLSSSWTPRESKRGNVHQRCAWLSRK